ncbi:hypothetical protein M514_04016 [Trichuris suis]|uniref:Uncharacterized protein n=1 Tax=Trichuris suis TaxID=68888 RepID=A0A085MD02_9BILA|nr:hypothetical protein M513_04016 [Trichuris suis]KFD72544.1 hypothetical protein M514_04016 [Trichuris suis]
MIRPSRVGLAKIQLSSNQATPLTRQPMQNMKEGVLEQERGGRSSASTIALCFPAAPPIGSVEINLL